jgi:hypothetical protein
MTDHVTVTFGDRTVTVTKQIADRFVHAPWYSNEEKRPPRLYSPAVFVAVPDPERPLPSEIGLDNV